MQILNIALLVLSVILAILGLIVSTGMNKILISVIKGCNEYINIRAYYLSLSISAIIFFILAYLKADAFITVQIYFLAWMISNILGSFLKGKNLSATSDEIVKIKRRESLKSLYIVIPVLLIIFIFQNHWVTFVLLLFGVLILMLKDLVFIDENHSYNLHIQYRFFYTTAMLHLFMSSAFFNLATNNEYYKIIKLIQFGCVFFMQAYTLLTVIFLRKQISKSKKLSSNTSNVM